MGMHSIPFVGTAPDGKWLLMQNLDNSILTYGALNRIRLIKDKVFKGHHNTGYACQVSLSPDGRYVLSGDGKGRCYFWDWKTTRIARSIKAHDGVCIGTLWHPF